MDEMNLFKTWKQATAHTIKSNNLSKEEIMEAIKSESSSTIGQIKNRMKFKLYWIALFMSITAIWTLFDHSNTELLYVQAFTFLMFSIGMIALYPVYKKMNNQISNESDTLSVMKTNANLLRRALKIETIWGLVFIPMSGFIGYTMSQLYLGHTFAEILDDQRGLLILLAVTFVIAPLANLGAYKANQAAFGEFIEELDQNIVKMEVL